MKGFTFDLQRFTDTVTEENAVAQIGDSYYETLQAAVDAVQSGGTITLLKDATGDGVKVASGKNFTLDFGGYTYDVNGKLVGSTGTETQAFQLLQNSTIKFRNGTITSSKALMLVQNYSNLTLEKMTLDGTKLQGSNTYTLSNNNGATVIKDSIIKAKTGYHAFDVCYYASYPSVSVTVEGNSLIDGKIELGQTAGRGYTNAQFTVKGGTFTGEMTYWNVSAAEAKAHSQINGGQFKVANETLGITTKVTAENASDNYFTTATLAAADKNLFTATIDGETKYFTTQALAKAATEDCVAKIGDDKYFSTLQKAVNAVDDNGTVTLLKDATGSGVRVDSGKNFTINFNTHTYTVDTPVGSTGTETNGFQLLKDSTIKFQNGKIAAGAYGTKNTLLRLIQNYANLTLENMDIDGSGLLVDSDGRKLVFLADNTIITVSTNNGTLNLTGTTSIEAIDTRYYKKDGKIEATTSGTALAVGYAAQSYPDGAQVNVNTTGAIDGINFGTWGQGGDKFKGSLTVKNGKIGEITVDNDALTLGAVNTITINGGTFANSAIKAGAKLLVVDNVLVAEDWNETANGFTYVAKPESGSVGVTAITVSDIDSVDDIKFDATQKVFVVPNTAKTSDLNAAYKLVTVTYDGTTAAVSTDATDIKIDANLLADNVTKISAAYNRTALDISGGDKVNSIVGGTKNDTLASANTGNVTMTGGDGSDIFVAGGNLTVTDYTVGEDKISVKANAGNPNVATNGNNLVLTFGSDTVNLLDAADKIVAVTKGTEIFYYNRDGETSSDGSAVTLDADIKTYTVKDPIKHADGSQTTNLKLTGDDFDNSLTGGDGNVKLSGDKGDDTLVATRGNTTMTGGKGDDLFVRGTGNAHITDYTAGEDKIFVDDAPTSFKFNGNNLVLAFDYDKTLTVTGAKNKALKFVNDSGSTVRTYIDNGLFSEGDTITLDEKFKGSGYNVAKNDYVRQIDASKVAVKVNLVGNNAGNTLKGGSGNDTLTGGKGDDEFTGGTGSDTFIYNGGNDIVTDYESETDTVKLNRGHTIQSATFGTDVVFNFDDGNFTLTGAADKTVVVKDASNKVWLYSQYFVAQGSGVTLQSAATEFDASSDVWKNLVTIDGSAASNAVITGNAKNNVITGNGQLGGSAGNDTLTGGKGSDTFVYTAGKDVVTNYGNGDTVSLGGDLTFTDITASKVSGQKVTFTVDKGTLTFNDKPSKIALVDANGDTAVLSADGLTTDTTKQVFNGTKTATVDSDSKLDASNVKNSVTITSAEDSTIVGNAGKTVYNYAGGSVKIENFAAGDKINYGKLDITDVSATQITFGDNGTIELVDHDADTKVQLIGTNDKGKSVTSTVYLGDHAIYNNVTANATAVSVTSNFEATGKIKNVTALGTNAIKVTGNDANNTLTANDAGSTLDGFAGTDVLIGGNGSDVFIHDKLTGTTTINGYTSTDSISLGEELSIVGSAYSPSSKNGTLTLTVANSDNASTSKIVIKSDDFSKTASPDFGTIVLNGETVSYGKNAIYYGDDEVKLVKLLSTFSGKFTATESSKVDGSDVTKTLTINGSTGNDTLTGGSNKSTLAGGKGDDSLIGGTGSDVFTYAEGDGSDVIAKFAYNDDKLKVTKANLIDNITFGNGKLTFSMTDGDSVTINDLDENILLKANDRLYWFDDDDKLVTAKTNTADMTKIINDKTGNYAVVNLDYSTNLVTAELATYTDATFSADTYKTT